MQVTKLIALDATQMGTQTCAALLGDRETAKLVNMVPSRNKADVYSRVAETIRARLQSMKATECFAVKELYRKHATEFFHRNVWKRPTMTILYGATPTTYANHLKEDVFKATGVELSNEDAQFLGKLTEEVLVSVLPAAVLLMRSLTGIVRTVIEDTNKPFIFTTATGSIFEAAKYKNISYRRLGLGAGMELEIKDSLPDLNIKATAKSAAAQFIQSFDAVIAGEIQERMIDRGIPLLSVFDSWAVPVGYSEDLIDETRKAYIKHLSNDPLKQFYDEAKRNYPVLWKHPKLFLERKDYRIKEDLINCHHFIGL